MRKIQIHHLKFLKLLSQHRLMLFDIDSIHKNLYKINRKLNLFIEVHSESNQLLDRAL